MMLSTPDISEQVDLSALSTLDQVIRLKDGLVVVATGGSFDGGDFAFRALRRELRKDPDVYAKLPEFLRSCTGTAEFWSFIQKKFPTYRERREFIRAAFAPLIEDLEANESSSDAAPMSQTLAQFNAEGVRAAWKKALNRRIDDPDGAITAARTLIETVCKHILDDAGIPYAANDDLPKLWHTTAKMLNLSPNQHQDEMFKAILGNCQTIVDRLAAIRNSVGDAHGQGRQSVKPTPRHAELAVNLAGSMAAFLVAVWEEQSQF
jgi:hypothetical protein